jgi:TonB-dependent SusC/RagA subfamily outer membrane receptor
MKNTHSKLILSVFLSFAMLSFANGQKKAIKERADRLIETVDHITVKGTVTTFNKFHVMNAEVTARKSRSKAFTDSLGRFEIMAPSGDVLIFTANGFEKNRRKVSSNEDEISVNMILKPGEKNEKRAIAYGHMSLKDIAYPARQSRNINNDSPKFSNLRGLVQAELPEAKVTDQGSIQVFIRGRNISSFGSSENNGAALFVLDGMIVPSIDFLNPWDVTSITLLKDARYSAIYGSRAANGVVLINTR